eukprot:m.783372 g.783372  ORF g.783372 m.783372 type:complete len:316 (+) comp59153_c0_seq19:127-1074(+)
MAALLRTHRAVGRIASSRLLSSISLPATADDVAVQKYEASPQSFKQFPIESIGFEPRTRENGKFAEPSLVVANRKVSGLVHVTPFSRALFPSFGPTGTLGKNKGFQQGKIDDPKLANIEMNLSNGGFPVYGQPNPLMVEYFAWLNAIEQKFLAHVTEAYKEYSGLQKRFGSLLDKSPDVRADLIASAFNGRSIKETRPKGDFPPEQFLAFKRKLYYRASPDRVAAASGAEGLNETDQQLIKEGFLRTAIPVISIDGADLGQPEIKTGDIVSVQYRLDGNMYEIGSNVGLSMRRNMMKVILLRQRPVNAAASKTPI